MSLNRQFDRDIYSSRSFGLVINLVTKKNGKVVACDPTYLLVACDPTYLVG